MPQQQQQQQQPLEEAAAVPLSPTGEQGTPLLPGSRLRGPQPPPVNPLQFIKVSPPVNLYKPPPPREVPPVVEQIRKEEPEDWQNDLEGWKVNRRKRQEQLMERVSEIKKMEEEQSYSAGRRNKTFSEMMRGRKCSIVVYNEGNENDLSELGIGNKSQEEEEEEENDVHEEENEALESEFTFEKAIQNYVDFASSRVCKQVTSAGSVTQSNDVNMTSTVDSTESTETDSWNNTSFQDKVSNNLVQQNKQLPYPEKKKEKKTQSSGLSEKISVFEQPLEIISPKKIDSKFKENIPTTPTKKLRPPVPSKPKAREEVPGVSFFQTTTMTAPQRDTWDSATEIITEISAMQETPENACTNSSSASCTELRLQPSVEHTDKLEPNPGLSDDSSNQDIELSLTTTSAEAPACETSLKLMEAPVISSSLDHVSPRDIQRSPLGGEDSGVHTADSVSQSDEVEEEEMPSLVDLEMPTGLLGILSSQGPIIDHELSALLAPPSRLEPPREKPPPPPPAFLEPDTETMRKSFLGLEVTAASQAAVVAVAAPEALCGAGDSLEADCLGTQLKERLLRLEEEKNNILNLEKHLKAEQLPPHPTENKPASKDSTGTQESLAVEREALRIEREVISTKKQAASFAKKLAVRSLESLDIPPHLENDVSNENETRIYHGNGSSTNNNIIPKKKLNFKKGEDETYIAQSLEKVNMPHYYHSPTKQHSIDELQTAYEPVANELNTENLNYNLPIRKSQSEDQLSCHQSVQQPYPSPPKQNTSNLYDSHPSHEQSFQKQYQSKQQENKYQQNVYQKHSPEQHPSQQYYTPPSPRYLDHSANNIQYYEDTQSSYFEPQLCETASVKTSLPASQGAWNKQPNYNPQAAAAIRKKGPPPPLKPSRISQQQQHHLTRNYSADSIFESVDSDPPVALRRSTGNSSANSGAGGGRSAMHYSLGGSMSQLPSHTTQQPRARPTSNQGINYQHWLVQEAEHRRITEQQQRQAAANPRQPKHLPDAIIMSLTQRVQQRQSQIPQRTSPQRNSMEDKILSVSGKKKCSHCNLELGRGAAMIIESLRLFYHIDCFKCCVCCIQLGDGLMGTDVRVRNGKLHCHSCYSSDDGVKFSCV